MRASRTWRGTLPGRKPGHAHLGGEAPDGRVERLGHLRFVDHDGEADPVAFDRLCGGAHKEGRVYKPP